jgi:hypothetical protein
VSRRLQSGWRRSKVYFREKGFSLLKASVRNYSRNCFFFSTTTKKSSRCDRAPVVCKYGEMDCIKKPMKIFYSYSSISSTSQVPLRIFTTRVNTYSRRIRIKHEFKIIDSQGQHLREDQFLVKQTDLNTFDIFLLEPCKASDRFSMELKIEFYNENQFQSCLLNKIYLFVV